MSRPNCEAKGTLPHLATKVLTWNLPAGRISKFMCDDHSVDASPQRYFVSKLVGYYERKKIIPEEE